MVEKLTVQELASLVGGQVVGNAETTITGVADLETASENDISFLIKANQFSLLTETKAGAVVIPDKVETNLPAIKVENPALAITLIHRKFLEKDFVATGVHSSVEIGKSMEISQEVSIGPQAVLADDITIGERVTIDAGVVIGNNVTIGDDVVIMANVVIRSGCRIGNRVIIQSGSVIGSDGYGYVQDEHGRHIKRPHVGIVVLEDDVEIGANCCVDRATFGATVIKQGAKIDNLVQIGHNVAVGEGCLIVAQCGVAGSTSLGRGVVLGGQVAVTDHVTLGDGVMVAGQSGVAGSVERGSVVGGYPANNHRTWLRASSVFSKLPKLVKDVRNLAKKLAQLEGKQDDES